MKAVAGVANTGTGIVDCLSIDPLFPTQRDIETESADNAQHMDNGPDLVPGLEERLRAQTLAKSVFLSFLSG